MKSDPVLWPEFLVLSHRAPTLQNSESQISIYNLILFFILLITAITVITIIHPIIAIIPVDNNFASHVVIMLLLRLLAEFCQPFPQTACSCDKQTQFLMKLHLQKTNKRALVSLVVFV